jgi:HJR/Mrr/RecB family endonuclease
MRHDITMNTGTEIDSPSKRERLLRFVRRFCQPETCAALQFDRFVAEIGDRESAELALKELWRSGYVVPTGTEIDPEDGALFEVPTPRIEDPVKDTSQFVLTDSGYRTVDSLYDPYSEHLSSEKTPELYVPRNIVVATEFINEKLMEELEKNPERMLSLSPRQFEELVAELFLREGFEVEITPERKDGGRDLLAVKHSDLGAHLYLAECKRYSPNRPVGVEYVRALYGVLETERATRGIIATTSYFTKGAQTLSQDLKWRIGLKNYIDLQAWIKKHTR